LQLPYLVWTGHEGLYRESPSEKDGAVYKTESPAACLAHLTSADREMVVFLSEFGVHLREPTMVGRLIELHDRLIKHRGAIFLRMDPADLPASIARYFTTLELRPKTAEAVHRYVNQVLGELRERRPLEVRMTAQETAELVGHLKSMPYFEIRKVITQAIMDDGRLDREDFVAVLGAKRRVIQRSGLLEYIPVEPGGAAIAGLGRLKDWLGKRAPSFREPERARSLGLPPPRGILLLGVQGCGKSLSAKVISAAFGLPLLRMEPGSLYRKYFGESEANLKRALKTAETVAPCILWLDEIEKSLGQGGDQDGGTARRVLGSFLTWLQEKKQPVFVFATANDISDLPPELLRKGRFDEIFFVDLPDHTARSHIFALHLAARKQDLSSFDLDLLAAKTYGFSGAEIEQLVVSGLYTALSEGAPLTTDILSEELSSTVPLSETMAEKIEALRSWAKTRAVAAD
jgi:hypothetical protein